MPDSEHSGRRTYEGPRRRHGSAKAVIWWLLTMAVMLLLAVAEAIVAHTVILVFVAGAAVAGAYVLGRRRGRAEAGRAAARRVEDAERERLVAELEQLARRSLAEIVSSYRVIQSNYTTPRDQR